LTDPSLFGEIGSDTSQRTEEMPISVSIPSRWTNGMLEDDDIDAVLQRLTDDLVLELAFEVRGCGSRPVPHRTRPPQ